MFKAFDTLWGLGSIYSRYPKLRIPVVTPYGDVGSNTPNTVYECTMGTIITGVTFLQVTSQSVSQMITTSTFVIGDYYAFVFTSDCRY
jgi:hypothetical protein